ncbi:MAG: 16S rRNA (guanine(527)-N(7))-methyltransferase RsmG [Lachnospiraceae bacterium]|nr:16S rRNA (guanine(527)-N(7))-methyltransferase RsmG [Lachnospiraceae bacterium]
MEEIQLLKNIFEANGIPSFDDHVFSSLVKFFHLVVEKNKVMNLTAITDFNDFAVKHYADSLSLLRILKPFTGKVIDVGTGAGFPGIPLAICCPEVSFTLFDSLRKRVDFLSEAVSDLGLNNVKLMHTRAEDAGRDPSLRDSFDIAVSRAVAPLSTLVEYTLPFVKPSGTFVAYKGPNSASEIALSSNALKTFYARVDHFHSFELCDGNPDGAGEKSVRTLLFVTKQKPTPKGYPRSSAKISKCPL